MRRDGRWRMWNGLASISVFSGAMFAAAEVAPMPLTITSPVFQDGGPIPARYTCDGQDSSPPLTWTEPPAGTHSFALISEDPDASSGVWVHWVVFNIPASIRQLPEAVPAKASLPDGTQQGTTDFGRAGYGGPCPPSGTHRYIFTLFALDTTLTLAPGGTKSQLDSAMQGHILTHARLMGTYHRSRR